MKKIALFALVAFCTVAAQAVTMKWSTGTNVYVNGYYEGSVASSITSASFAAQITFSENITSNTSDHLKLLTFDTANNANWYDVYLWCGGKAEGKQDMNFTNGNSWYPNPGVFVTEDADRSYSFVMTIEKTADGAANLKGYINADKVMDLTFETAAGLRAWANTNETWYTLENTAAYDGLLSEEEIAWMAENNTAVLPEPTALALLALGVAGLALKRKNA